MKDCSQRKVRVIGSRATPGSVMLTLVTMLDFKDMTLSSLEVWASAACDADWYLVSDPVGVCSCGGYP